MFSRIDLANFRAIAGPIQVPLKPLTILVGENGAGKTSVLEAIALTAQSATEQPRLQDLVVQGTKWIATDIKEIYHAHDMNLRLSVGLTMRTGNIVDELGLLSTIATLSEREIFPAENFTYTWTRHGEETTVWSHRYDLDNTTLWDWHGELLKRDQRGSEARTEAYILMNGQKFGPLHPLKTLDRVLPEQIFGPPGQVFLRDRPTFTDAGEQRTAAGAAWQENIDAAVQKSGDILRPLADEMRQSLSRVSMMDPLRGKDLLTFSNGEAFSPGRHGENLLRLLTTLPVRQAKTFERFRSWAAKFGLESIEAGSHNNHLDLSAVDQGGTTLRFSEFATGSFQGLLIAAQILLAQARSVLLIEEPEANMHPAFEKLLADLFADGVSLGHQVIVTTHSEILVAAVGGLVRKGSLDPEQVGIIEMSRDPQGVKARQIEITERGLGEWVRSFTKVESALSQEWAHGIPEE